MTASGYTDEAYQVMLIHETVHAYDMQRYPELRRRLDAPTSEGEMQAAVFVLEGHAQWVTKRIAKRLGLQEAFDAWHGSLTESVRYENMWYGYRHGPPWFQDLFEEGGLPEVERALRDPPRTRP